jgi:hypothetical protein
MKNVLHKVMFGLVIALLFGMMGCGGGGGQPASSVTGRWDAIISSGDVAGDNGILLTQSGNTVTGAGLQNGTFENGVLTGSFNVGLRSFDIRYSLSNDGNSLVGQTTLHVQGWQDIIIPATYIRKSNNPVNPDLSTPVVINTTPSINQTGVARSNLTIVITWSKPMCGCDVSLSGKIGGVQTTLGDDFDLIDTSKNTYDSVTYTYTLHMWPSIVLDPQTNYTIKLSSNNYLLTGIVNWSDPYGILPWQDINDAYSWTFTTGN